MYSLLDSNIISLRFLYIIMDTQALILSLFVAFLWAINTIIYKYGMNQSVNQKTVIVIGAFTYFICMTFFTMYHYDIISNDIQQTNIKHIVLIIIGSIIGTFIASILFIHLLEKHNSSLVTTLAYTTPVFVALMAIFILKEDIDTTKFLGICITIFGVFIINFS